MEKFVPAFSSLEVYDPSNVEDVKEPTLTQEFYNPSDLGLEVYDPLDDSMEVDIPILSNHDDSLNVQTILDSYQEMSGTSIKFSSEVLIVLDCANIGYA